MTALPAPNLRYLERAHEARPSLTYRPGRTHDLDGRAIDPRDNGQLQLHSSSHVFRYAAPGNGWGKTTLAAVEVDWWGNGFHPLMVGGLPPTPARQPRQLWWICQKFDQWLEMKPKAERWWPKGVSESWHGSEHSYTWPNETTLKIYTAESDWKTMQGPEPALVVVDEECGAAMWYELIRRRRGTEETDTRYLITATATQGLTWTYSKLYAPWLKFHADRGMDETQAKYAQAHIIEGTETPGIFVWPNGSHRENPIATKNSWAYQLSLPAGSKAERLVRLYGGHRDFAGTPVFDSDCLEKMRVHLKPGRMGRFEEVRV